MCMNMNYSSKQFEANGSDFDHFLSVLGQESEDDIEENNTAT